MNLHVMYIYFYFKIKKKTMKHATLKILVDFITIHKSGHSGPILKFDIIL